MSLLPRFLPIAFLSAIHVQGQETTDPAVQIRDVPVWTQRGPGPGRYVPPVPARANLPTLWLIGDSTVRNGSKGDNGPDGQWGWGAPVVAYFDLGKINVVNRALGGMSSRSFYHGSLWRNLQPLIRKGDFVVIQFGANDNGSRGALKGVGEETEARDEETVHTFGWYLRQYAKETRAKGATPIICSLTPRKGWSDDGKFRGGGQHVDGAEQAAKATETLYVPLNEIISRTYETLGQKRVDALYVPSPRERLHTGWEGAAVNAKCVIAGLKALPTNPLAAFFSKRADAVLAWKQ